MGKNTGVLAIDFGGSSGRVMYGTYDGKRINLQEVQNERPVFGIEPFYMGKVIMPYEMHIRLRL